MGTRVLLFGQESAGLQVLAMQLRARAYEVVEDDPNLIVLYGGTNAAATLANFSQSSFAGAVPTLAVLSDTALMGSAAMVAAGVTDFLVTPVSEGALNNRLNDMLRDARELDELLDGWPEDLPPPDPKAAIWRAPLIALEISDRMLRQRVQQALSEMEVVTDLLKGDILIQDVKRATRGPGLGNHACTLTLAPQALAPLARDRLLAAGLYRLLEAPFSDLYLRQWVLSAVNHCARKTQLERALAEMQSTSSRDAVTGLRTRAFAQSMIERKMEQEGTSGALALIDLDDLKLINDRLGHAAGDEALRHIAQRLNEAFDGAEILARWGGDEMLVFDPAGEGLERVLRTCQDQVSEFVVGQGDRRARRIGFSFGVARIEEGTDLEAVLEIADERLYAQKTKKKEARKASQNQD